MALTQDEIQSVVSAVLSSLQTNSMTIDQLVPVTSLADGDCFEINGGKRVTYQVLCNLIASLSSAELENLKTLINKCELDSVSIGAEYDSATLEIASKGKKISVSIPVATNTKAGFISADDIGKLRDGYDVAKRAADTLARLGILPFDRVVYAVSELSGAASGTVAFSIQEHIFVVAGSGGGVSPMSSYNATIAEGLPCPRTDRLYSCSGALYVADPESRNLIKTATLADTVQVMSEVSEVKLAVLDVSDRLETVEDSGIPGLRSSIEDCARRIEAVGDSVGDLESRLVPEAMEISAPERLTFGNTAEIYIGTRLLPDGVMHNVIYISDGKSVTVDHRGRLRIAGRGTSAVQVIPTCATSLARTVLITVSDPAMRLCAGGGPVRLTSSGSCRFS